MQGSQRQSAAAAQPVPPPPHVTAAASQQQQAPPPGSARRRSDISGMRARVAISSGAKVLLRHRDTIAPASVLAHPATSNAHGSANPAYASGGAGAHRTAYTSSSPGSSSLAAPPSATTTVSRLMDRFDLPAMSVGCLSLQAPTRVLPYPPAPKNAPKGDSPGPSARGAKAPKTSARKNESTNGATTLPPAKPVTSSGGAAMVTEHDLITSASTYVWPSADAQVPSSGRPSAHASAATLRGQSRSGSVPTTPQTKPVTSAMPAQSPLVTPVVESSASPAADDAAAAPSAEQPPASAASSMHVSSTTNGHHGERGESGTHDKKAAADSANAELPGGLLSASSSPLVGSGREQSQQSQKQPLQQQQQQPSHADPRKTPGTLDSVTAQQRPSVGPSALPPPAAASSPTAPATAVVTPVLEPGSVLMWSTQPTLFALYLVEDGVAPPSRRTQTPDEPVSEPTTPQRPSRGLGGSSTAPPSPGAPSPASAAHASGSPSLGTGCVQLAAISFASRCTASATFTTHRSWRVATGTFDRFSARAVRTSRRTQQCADGCTGGATAGAEHGEFVTPQPASRAAAVRRPSERETDFSPAASDPVIANHRRGESNASTGTAPPAAALAASDGCATSTATLAGESSIAADLWSAFGFVNGDIVIWNHATRSVLKRHNSCRLSTRVVAHASVTAICRVEREGAPETPPYDAASSSAALPSADECDCGVGGTSDGSSNGIPVKHNAMTCVFGDLAVAFDNGTIVVVRLNQTGGFIDDERAAWIGFAPIHVMKPCPAYPRVLALACGDGCVRFLHFPASLVAKKLDLQPDEVGTAVDPRMLAVTPCITAHGGVTALDWHSDGSAVVAGCQDDSVAYISVGFDTSSSPGRAWAAFPTRPQSARSGDQGNFSDPQMATPRTSLNTGLPPLAVQPPLDSTSRRSTMNNTPQPEGGDGADGSRPLFVEIRGIVRRKFHRSWLRDVLVVPVVTELVKHEDDDALSPDGSSVASHDAVTLGGVRDTPVPTELSHLALCAAEDGSVSLWHMPNRDQLMHLTPARGHGPSSMLGANPSLAQIGGLQSNTSFIGMPATNASFASPGANSTMASRPMSAATPNAAAGNTPGMHSFAALPSGGGGAPSASFARQPCGVLPRLTKLVTTSSGRGGVAEAVIDDTVVAIAPLPAQLRRLQPDFGDNTPRLGSFFADPSAPTVPFGAHDRLETPSAFVALTAKGLLYVWTLEPTD